MPGAGRRTFVAGEKLTANQVNNYLQDQAVMRFPNEAGRTADIPTPSEGMVTYLDDVNELFLYDGADWNRVGNAKIYIQDTQPASGVDGDFWFDDSSGVLRIYYDATSTWISVGGGGGGGIETVFLLMGA
jgi:hypothetical protein